MRWRLDQTDEWKMSESYGKHPSKRLKATGAVLGSWNRQSTTAHSVCLRPAPLFFTQKHLLTGHQASNIDRAVWSWETTPLVPDTHTHTQEAFGARSTVSDVNRFTIVTCDPEEQRSEESSPPTQVKDPLIIINNTRSWWWDYHTQDLKLKKQTGKCHIIPFLLNTQLIKHGVWQMFA